MTLAEAIARFDDAHPGPAGVSIEVPSSVWAAWVEAARREQPQCVVPGCSRVQHCDGLCKRHHRRAVELGFINARVEQLRTLAAEKKES